MKESRNSEEDSSNPSSSGSSAPYQPPPKGVFNQDEMETERLYEEYMNARKKYRKGNRIFVVFTTFVLSLSFVFAFCVILVAVGTSFYLITGKVFDSVLSGFFIVYSFLLHKYKKSTELKHFRHFRLATALLLGFACISTLVTSVSTNDGEFSFYLFYFLIRLGVTLILGVLLFLAVHQHTQSVKEFEKSESDYGKLIKIEI